MQKIKESPRCTTSPAIRHDQVPAWLVYVGLLVVQIGFGINPVLLQMYVNDPADTANPLVFSFYRDACCLPILFLCAIVAERKLLVPSGGMLCLFMVLGLSMFASQYLYILTVYHAGPTLTSAFQPTIPIWTSIAAAITCTEKLPSYRRLKFWAKFLGIFLAAGGAVEMVLTGGKKADGVSEQGMLHYLLLLSNPLLTSFSILMQKQFIFSRSDNKWKDYPLSITAYTCLFGAIFIGITSLQYINEPHEYKIPPKSLYALAYAIFVTSSLCYLLVTWANSQISSIVVTAFWPVQVLVTAVVAWFLIGDHLDPLQYLGAGVLILGLFLVLWSEY